MAIMVYKFVVLSDEDESFMREFEFLDSQTLLDFHNIIQEELEFDKSQMASFFMATDNWEKEEEFTLFDMGTGSSSSSSSDTIILLYSFFELLPKTTCFGGTPFEFEQNGYSRPVTSFDSPVYSTKRFLSLKKSKT